MNNKVLIKLIVPSLMEEFEIFIPVNERIFKIKELLINMVFDLSDNTLDTSIPYSLIDVDTGTPYDNTQIVRDTNIRNNKAVILYKKI